VLAIFINHKLRPTIGDVIIVVNVIIFLQQLIFFLSEIAVYSMITLLYQHLKHQFLWLKE